MITNVVEARAADMRREVRLLDKRILDARLRVASLERSDRFLRWASTPSALPNLLNEPPFDAGPIFPKPSAQPTPRSGEGAPRVPFPPEPVAMPPVPTPPDDDDANTPTAEDLRRAGELLERLRKILHADQRD